MKTEKYQLRVKGLQTSDGTISVRALSELLQKITACAERGLRLAIEGLSVRRGILPAWIEKSTGLVVTGMATRSTVLDIEAPMLGETIGDMLSQQDFWVKRPKPEDTALSIVSKSIHDTTAEDLESDYYDAGVLNSFLEFKHFLSADAQGIELHSLRRPQENFRLDSQTIEKIERLKVKTPEPQAFIVSGLLDQIGHSRKKFKLVIKGSQIIPGRIDEEFMTVEDMRQLWGRKVTVKGMVHFKPSGTVRLLEAHLLKPMADGEDLFEFTPVVRPESDFLRQLIPSIQHRDWLQDICGQWPGDEPIEELLVLSDW